MDSTGTLILGASCGALCIAGSYLFMNKDSFLTRGGTNNTVTKLKDDVDDKLFPAGKMSIYFGSQTGTAESFARVLEKEGTLKGFRAKRVDLEDFDPSQLAKCDLAVFLMATYGEGEHTDNATNFNNWMKNEGQEDRASFLKGMSFTVFGLGNRQYEHFNQMGKRTNEALHNCGGTRVFEYGEGDDDGTLEEDFDKWKTSMWPSLISQFHPDGAAGSTSNASDEESTVKLTFKVVPGDAISSSFISKTHPNKPFFQAKQATVTANRELRCVGDGSGDIGSTRCVEINLVGTGLSYNTADNLAVLPENDANSVAILAKALGYALNQPYNLQYIPEPDKEPIEEFPCPFTARDVLTRFFDIHGLPRASTLSQLLPYITDLTQRSWLRNLLLKDNKADFKKYIEGGGKTVFELLTNELSSCVLPLEDFMHIMPHMQPRYYTISSSSSCFPDSVHITVSVTEMAFLTGKKSKGLCSSYLQGLLPNKSACRVYVRPSTFKLPKSLSTPIVMIGPGTGIAPMRALLQERKFLGGKGNSAGKNTLYFGCKDRSKDYLYRDEIEEYTESKVLSSLHLAFSREQKQKIYVQQLIQIPENGKDLVSDLDNGGHLYVCGGTTMGADVMEAIIGVISTHQKIGRNEAVEYVKKLQQQGRYVQELWTTA